VEGYLVEPIGPFATALGTAKNTFTTKQDISPLPVPIIPGYKLRQGTRLKIEAEGEISSTGSPTFIFGLYIGSIGTNGTPSITTDIALSSAVTIGAGAAAWPWRLEWRGICTTVGTSGAVVGQGDVEYGTSLTALTTVPFPITAVLRTVTWDTTIARAIGLSGTWSASSASNSVTVHNQTVIVFN
jgi:hypothetical protein